MISLYAGVVAQRHPELFASQLQGALEALERCIGSPLLRCQSGRAAADGTACALLKVYAGFCMNLGIEATAAKVATLLETWSVGASASLFPHRQYFQYELSPAGCSQ